ncbi:MAG: peptide chain release factor 1 [Candidatus Staskawiczbacteria bacterium RIFOXYD1_FULL_39_28]|uniref:Peptide chain release factor 1 n=1 Tax=Candidatus Staskawiczbacteria bacterium RIFOXYC1_FULL_38_18 TaxID=1802229 RepID=A0A1G2JH04_9BACT|nr:MAG: peptide chain release factor 1 [Candidatus Staskawiczbacteria bacterium RIFOXYC1_FULL_38_18]OGZ92378.1 MAG: peptide chain release factor 1 [Candidatus Staskawiczbacteria bacterium RIFOXYD1_FULL_39_28]
MTEQDFSKFTAEDWKNYKPDIPEEEEKTEKQSAIFEIRAGQGGDEAGLFAHDLYRMYSRYGQTKGWKERVLDQNISSVGGYKEIIFELSGTGVYDELQNEGGVHRVQRIPSTEKQGRVHTSTATVAVLLKPKKTEANISPADLEISTFKSSGPGGQYVNKTESAIRIVHKPSGLVVTCQSERNQLQNKETAMTLLAARLLEAQERSDLSKLSTERRDQIGWATRSEKMRTYNFPQDRITDHRINKSWHDIESIMDGKLDGIVKAFKK